MNPKLNEHLTDETESTARECPNCRGGPVRTTLTTDRFVYGEGPSAAELTATVPLHTCDNCGFQFLDEEAEVAHHESVCRHLGVLTPAQIRDLRRRYDLSRTEFAQVTKLGEATIARWERGALIQNAAYDQFLYLLSFEENLERLRHRSMNCDTYSSAKPDLAQPSNI